MAETKEHDQAMNCKRSISILIVVWALLCPSILYAGSFEGKVVGISDGDTIKV